MFHPTLRHIFTKVEVRYVLVFCECCLVYVSSVLVSFKVALYMNLNDFTMYTFCSRCHTDVTVHIAALIRALRLSYVSLVHCRRLAIQQTDFVLKHGRVFNDMRVHIRKEKYAKFHILSSLCNKELLYQCR